MKRKISLFQEGLPEPKFFEKEMEYARIVAQEAVKRGAMQNVPELTFFLSCALQKRPNNQVLEIGSAAGGNFAALCAIAEPEAILVSIDLPRGKFGGGTVPKLGALKNFRVGAQKVYSFHADSHIPTVLEQVKNCFYSPVDLLFIDGDHTYEGVMKDYEMYGTLVKEGGLIAFHGIKENNDSEDEMHKAWDEIKKSCKYREIINPEKPQGIGIIYK